jgi:predicted ATPase
VEELLLSALLPRPRHLVLVEDPEAHARRTLPARQTGR